MNRHIHKGKPYRKRMGIIRSKRDRHLYHRYSLSEPEYDALLKKQNGVCAICKRPPKDRNLAVDHDHKCCPGTKTCGKCVRGLLCSACNTAVGIAETFPLQEYLSTRKGPSL